MKQHEMKRDASKVLLRKLQVKFSSQYKTHQSYGYTRYSKTDFLSLEVKFFCAIFLGETSHWKVGVWVTLS
jgi:hypothetical protein